MGNGGRNICKMWLYEKSMRAAWKVPRSACGRWKMLIQFRRLLVPLLSWVPRIKTPAVRWPSPEMLPEVLCGGSGNRIPREQMGPSAPSPHSRSVPACIHLGPPMATAMQELEGAPVDGTISPLDSPAGDFMHMREKYLHLVKATGIWGFQFLVHTWPSDLN